MIRTSLVPLFITLLLSIAQANHGPGTSGGGSSTASGETMKQGGAEVTFRLDYTQFEDITNSEASRLARKGGEFDSLNDSLVATFEAAYGITNDFQLGAQIGYYWGSGFVDAESENGIDVELATTDPEGLTDLWITGKYRILKGRPGHLSVIGGVKFPTGRDDVKLSNGNKLEPSSQPGSGSYDFQLGLAYSRFLTSQLTIDASAVYTFRTEHDGFEVGDRFDFGTALAYRLTESIKKFPQCSVFGELTGVWLGKDDSDDEGPNPNSGGSTLYLTPGLRIRFNPQWSLTTAISVPVMQDLNGEQIETTYKATLALSWSL
ncbi:MAG TPA: transporter [Tepidisphaeraceae bacterium]|nr:transporter [Tepidisphaeraceae bacterium]